MLVLTMIVDRDVVQWIIRLLMWLCLFTTHVLMFCILISQEGVSVHGHDVSPHTTLELIYSQDDTLSDIEILINKMSAQQIDRDKCGSQEASNMSKLTTRDGNERIDINKLDNRSRTPHTEPIGWPPWPTLQENNIKTEADRIYFKKYKDLPKRSTDCDNVQRKLLNFYIFLSFA